MARAWRRSGNATTIEMNARGAVERALDEMLSQWLNCAEVRTWPHVIEALDRPNIAQRRLAVQLRNDHCREYVMEFEESNGGRGGSNGGSGGSNGGNHSGNSGSDEQVKQDPPVKPPCDRRKSIDITKVDYNYSKLFQVLQLWYWQVKLHSAS